MLFKQAHIWSFTFYGKLLPFEVEFENIIDCIRLDILNFSLNKFPLVILEIWTVFVTSNFNSLLRSIKARSIFSQSFSGNFILLRTW